MFDGDTVKWEVLSCEELRAQLKHLEQQEIELVSHMSPCFLKYVAYFDWFPGFLT